MYTHEYIYHKDSFLSRFHTKNKFNYQKRGLYALEYSLSFASIILNA